MKLRELTIYGASDDLIEFTGCVKEEVSYYEDGDVLISVSDGTELSMRYDFDGIWRFHRIKEGACDCTIVKDEACRDTAPGDYTDVVTLTGTIDWVECLGKKLYCNAL